MYIHKLASIARPRTWYRRPLTWAFAVLLLIVGIIAGIASYSLHKVKNEILDETLTKVDKLRLLDEMVHHSRQRSVLLRDLVLADDPFDQDEIMLKHSSLAGKYLEARTQLENSRLMPEEKAVLGQIIEQNSNGYELQRQIIDLATTGHQDEAQKLIANELGPNREKIYPNMMKIRELLVDSSRESSVMTANLLSRQQAMLNWLLAAALFIGFSIAWLAYKQEMRHNRRLSWQACHDPLTGLANRFEAELGLTELINTARDQEKSGALIYLDIDQFNVINNSSGQEAGDELLRQVASHLDTLSSDKIKVYRVGGDQFAVLVDDISIEDVRVFARLIHDVISSSRFEWSDRSYDVSCSIGVVPVTSLRGAPEKIWSDAYIACALAKDKGGDRVQISVESAREARRHRESMDWVTRLRRAIKEDRLVLYRQGIVSLGNKAMHSEILLRYEDDDGELISAANFIPAAERYKFITEIDTYVCRKMIQFMAAETEKNTYSINLSGRSLGNRDLLDMIVSELDYNKVDPERIAFEITETAAIQNHTDALRFMNVLHGIGCHFLLDDFGTGLSSFGYLKTLPLDIIKIDAYFIQGIYHEKASRSIVQAITTIAHGFGLKTVAEGVETDEQLTILRELGVDYVQGYLIERPTRLMAA